MVKLKFYLSAARRLQARHQLSLVAALLLSTTIVLAFITPSLSQSSTNHDELKTRGKHLQAEIKAQYENLNSKQASKKTKDITSTVLLYASPSMSIEELTKVLRYAGFREPYIAHNRQMVFSMAVGVFPSFEQVVVQITPKSDGDFHAIESVTGVLLPAYP